MTIFKLNLLISLLGLEIGSFANVCIYRWPRGNSIIIPARSYCPWCKTQIRWFDNVPVLSFLALGGKCRVCHVEISARYPLIELALPALWLPASLIYFHHFASLAFLGVLLFLIFGMLVSTVTDLDWRIIPDEISYGLICAGLFSSPWNVFFSPEKITDAFLTSILGAAVGAVLPLVIAKVGKWFYGREVMGLGDVKLLAGIGSILGWKAAVMTFFAGSCLGSMTALIGLVSGRLKRHDYIPFGPALNVGGYVILLMMMKYPGFLDGLL